MSNNRAHSGRAQINAYSISRGILHRPSIALMTQFEQIFSKACIVGSTMKLGIFDSGIGGEAVAASLQALLPEATIQVVNDRKNVPYGSKTTEEVISLTHAAIQPLLEGNCDIIILACNTASAAAIETLRTQY